MPYSEIWSHCSLSDIVYLLLLLNSLLLGLVSFLNYRFYPQLLGGILYFQEELYLQDFINKPSFKTLQILGKFKLFLLFSLIIFLIIQRLDSSPSIDSVASISLVIGKYFLCILLFFAFHKLIYKTLGSIYLGEDLRRNFLFFYDISFWTPIIPLYIAILLLLHKETFIVGSSLSIGFFLLWRILIIRKAIHGLQMVNASYIQVSLYLCSQEIIPFVLAFGVLLNQ